MKKRLAILIALMLMLTSMPLYAFADGDDASAGAAAGEAAEVNVTEQSRQTPGTDPGSSETAGQTGDENGDQSGDQTGSGNDDQTGTDPADADQPSDQPEITYPCWNDDHTSYYDKNGKMAKNTVLKIKGVRYYFNKKGKLDMSNGWKTTSSAKYYIKKGKIVTKPTKIKNSKNKTYLYMFLSNGKLKTTKGLYKVKGKEYYGLGSGRLKTGWLALSKKNGKTYEKAMYFYKSGKKIGSMAKNTKIKYLKIPKNGRLGKAYYLGVKKLDSIGWSLRKAYSWSAHMTYQGRYYRAKDSETYAIKGFSKGYGNCYCMAGTFYIMAKLLGYDVHQVEGRVDLPHSWTVIKQDGREWVYDPNFTNETGRNGWKIRYGQKGTWRYNHYHKMN